MPVQQNKLVTPLESAIDAYKDKKAKRLTLSAGMPLNPMIIFRRRVMRNFIDMIKVME